MSHIKSGLLIAILVSLFIGSTHTYINLAQENDCNLVNQFDSMPVFFAPIYAYGQLKDILPKGTEYTMIGETNEYFRIAYGDGEYGWIDWHRFGNGSCVPYTNYSAYPDTPMNEFPSVCLFKPHDPAWTRSVAVVSIHDEKVQLSGSVSQAGPLMHINDGELSGFCEGTIQLAYARENARVWTQPNVLTGEVLLILEETTQVGIISERIRGNIQADMIGEWVQIQHGELVGWIWLDRLDMGRYFTTQQPIVATAMIGENMRLWSAPDAQVGEVIMELPSNRRIIITGDAIQGNIQFHSDLQGTWYPVQFGATVGWAYATGLIFDAEVVYPMPWHTQ